MTRDRKVVAIGASGGIAAMVLLAIARVAP